MDFGERMLAVSLVANVLALLCIISAQPVTAGEIQLYGSKKTTRFHSEEKPYRQAYQIFKGEFSKQSYFGAFASSASGHYAWVGQHNTVETAIEYAMGRCQSLVKPGQQDCALYATVVPKGYRESGGITLGQANTKTYRKFLKLPAPAALAVSDIGASSFAHGGSSPETVKARALRICNENAREEADGLHKVYKCRLIAVKEVE